MPGWFRVMPGEVFDEAYHNFYQAFETGPEISERHLRALEAHVMLFSEFGLIFMPTVYTQTCLLYTSYDYEIPMKYGVDQCIGDSMGPGGVFRCLRSAPVIMGIGKDIKELCPDEMCIRDSTKTVELGQECDGCFVSIRAKCESFSCRAQNSRRLEMRGAIGLGIAVYQNRTISAVCDCPELQIHRKPVTACDRKFYVSKEFTIREELRVGESRPPIREIVDYSAEAELGDYKLLANKVICKGELRLDVYKRQQAAQQKD